MSAPPPATRALVAGLCGWTLLALALRLACIDRLLPHAPEPDAFLVGQVLELAGEPVPAEHLDYWERYPLLFARVIAATTPVSWAVEPADDSAGALTDAGAEAAVIAAAKRPYVRVRAWVAFLAALAVPLTVLLARRFVSAGAATFAGACVALDLLHLSFSTQARPHAPATTLILFAAWCAVRHVERPSLARAGLAVASAGLALAGLQNGILALVPLAASFLHGPAPRAPRFGRAAFAVALAVALALPFYPTLPSLADDGIQLAGAGAHVLTWEHLDGGGFARIVRCAYDFAPLLALCAALGGSIVIVRAVRRPRGRRGPGPAALVLIALAATAVLVLGLDGDLRERFALPLVPLAALLAGAALDASRGVLRVIAWATLLFPAASALRFVQLACTDDAYERVAALAAGLPERRILTEPGLVLPLVPETEALDAALRENEGLDFWTATLDRARGVLPVRRTAWWRFPDSIAHKGGDQADDVERVLARNRPAVVVLSNLRSNAFVGQYAAFRARVETEGHPRAQLRASGPTGGPVDRGPVHPYQGQRKFWLRLFEIEAFGPDFELWSLPAPGDARPR